MRNLTDQVVLVTGCSSGIGRALARAFAAKGHRTFATARNLDSLGDLEEPGIERLRLDVLDTESVKSAIDEVVVRAGRIDLVVNNAGYILAGPLAELPLSEFQQLFGTNVAGALAVVQAAFPHMARARSGRVVNIGSVVGVLPTPFAGAYCASKSALHMLSEVLRMELLPFGIDVVLVEPGSVRSNIADRASHGLERYASEASYYKPVHRHIERRARTSQERPMDTNSFARRVVEVCTRVHPPRVVREGRHARILTMLAQLPRFVREPLLMRRFGVHELAGSRKPSRETR